MNIKSARERFSEKSRCMRENKVKNLFLALSIFFVSLSCVPAFASQDCPNQYIIGPVVKIDVSINRLWVKDEMTKETRDFFVHDNFLKDLKVSDRVTVNFRCGDQPPDSVIKMTPVESGEKENQK